MMNEIRRDGIDSDEEVIVDLGGRGSGSNPRTPNRGSGSQPRTPVRHYIPDEDEEELEDHDVEHEDDDDEEDIEARSPKKDIPNAIRMRFNKPAEEEVAVLFQDLEYSVPLKRPSKMARVFCCKKDNGPREKALLTGVSGVLYYGELIALMGGSGCGKSTLLDILALRKDADQLTGTLLHNGKKRTGLNSQDAAYVLQTDLALSTLTVYETLMFAARFRMGMETSQRDLDGLVRSLLRELRLEEVADTRVGSTTVRGISGGEMRRLAIGEALISNPRMLFLDEPTSGLDSSAAFGIGKLLKRLSRTRNQIVICSIHQPSPQLFALFDKVLLLSKGPDGIGRIGYLGRASGLKNYLVTNNFIPPPLYNIADYAVELSTARQKWGQEEESNTNPNQDEDALLSVNSAGKIEAQIANLATVWQNSPQANILARQIESKLPHEDDQGYVEEPIRFASEFRHQFKVFAERAFLDTFRQPSFFFARILKVHFIGFFICTLFPLLGNDVVDIQNTVSLIFFIILSTFLLSQIFIGVFIAPRPLVIRERDSRLYGASVQFFGTLAAGLPLEIFNAAIFGTYIYWICGLRADVGYYFAFLCLFIVTSLWSDSFTMLISAIAPNPEAAITILPVIFMFFLMFCGYFVLLQGMPVWWKYWAPYISPLRYALSAGLYTQFHDVTFNTHGQNVTSCQYSNGNELLAFYGVTLASDIEMWGYIGIVLLFTLTFFALVYLALRNLKWGRR